MSEIKVNKITPRTNCGTTTLGDSGDTFTIPAGATISNLGTATGFGGTGVVSWDTSSIKTTGFTAVTGTGYFCNTTSGPFTVTLPLSPSAGDVIGVADYAKTFDTDALTLGRNGSNIAGEATDAVIGTEGIAVTLVYVDVTKGWIVTDSGLQSDAPGPKYVAATGGCVTTCGNFKMHTFWSPGTLTVSCAGNSAGSNMVSYMVVAGGGGAGRDGGGGGGAGGFREGRSPSCSYTASPLAVTSCGGLSVSAIAYPIVVGGGGAGSTGGPPNTGSKGDDSTFSTITSTGGGYGSLTGGGCGGSGGGGGRNVPRLGASGNTPTQTPAQGTDGGNGDSNGGAGAGGGATAAGLPAACSHGPGEGGGTGGAGAGTAINTTTIPTKPTGSGQAGTPGPSGSLRYFAGGGGGAGTPSPNAKGTGGTGGGGDGVGCGATDSVAGTVNTGGGGGGGTGGPSSFYEGKAGGSGIVIIRYKYQ